MPTSPLFLHGEAAAEISWFVTTKLGPITGTLMADVRSDSEPEDEGFYDIDSVEEVLSAVPRVSHKFPENRENSIDDSSVI